MAIPNQTPIPDPTSIPVLAVSDETDPRLHSATVRERLGHVALVIGCGDLPTGYLEFLADALNRPVYYVLGNHADELRRGCCRSQAAKPMGAIDLGGGVVRDRQTGLLLAGFPGSPRYGEHEPAQYAEREIWWMIAKMAPRLLWNRLRHGRALDVLVSHAPPRHVNDREDPAHRGYEALRPFLRWCRPAVHLHGHIHLYDRSLPSEQRFEATRVVNVFPYKVVDLALGLEPDPVPNPVAAPVPPPAPERATAAVSWRPAAKASPVSTETP